MKSDKGKAGKKSGGLSFRSDDAIETGLFASGPAGIKEGTWALFDYGGNAKPTPVLLVTFTREGEQDYEQPYSIGRGWKIKNGELLPLNGQSGLPKSCNAMRHLIKPLEKALEASDAPEDFMDKFPENLSELSGVIVARVEQESRDIKEKGKGASAKPKDDKQRTILEIEEITEASWIKGSKKKSKGKAKDEDADDDADEDEDEDEEPAKGKKTKPAAADDDDDEDEDDDAPKGKKKKPAASDDDDDEAEADEDDDADDELKEEGIEALISALEANDGKLTEDELPKALAAVLKKNKNAKAIVKLMVSDDGLELEKGWSYNAKKGLVTAD